MSLFLMRKNQKAEKELEDTNVLIRTRRKNNTMSEREKDRQHNVRKRKGQTTIYKTLNRKLKIEQHEPRLKLEVNACVPGGR